MAWSVFFPEPILHCRQDIIYSDHAGYVVAIIMLLLMYLFSNRIRKTNLPAVNLPENQDSAKFVHQKPLNFHPEMPIIT